MTTNPMTRRATIAAGAAAAAAAAVVVVLTGGSSPQASAGSPSPSGSETCSVWTVPTLETGPVAVTAPAAGVPYVLVCLGADGVEQPARTVIFSTTER